MHRLLFFWRNASRVHRGLLKHHHHAEKAVKVVLVALTNRENKENDLEDSDSENERDVKVQLVWLGPLPATTAIVERGYAGGTPPPTSEQSPNLPGRTSLT